MSAISQFSDFDDGVAAGRRLLRLSEELDSDFARLPAASAEQVAEVIAFLRRYTIANRPYPAVEGFLSTVLRKETASMGIAEFLGAEGFVHEQRTAAPLGNLPDDAPFVLFATWAGEEEGDAWVLDLEPGYIRCIPLSVHKTDPVSVRAISYGVFSTLDHFVAHLRCEAEMREWIQPSAR